MQSLDSVQSINISPFKNSIALRRARSICIFKRSIYLLIDLFERLYLYNIYDCAIKYVQTKEVLSSQYLSSTLSISHLPWLKRMIDIVNTNSRRKRVILFKFQTKQNGPSILIVTIDYVASSTLSDFIWNLIYHKLPGKYAFRYWLRS